MSFSRLICTVYIFLLVIPLATAQERLTLFDIYLNPQQINPAIVGDSFYSNFAVNAQKSGSTNSNYHNYRGSFQNATKNQKFGYGIKFRFNKFIRERFEEGVSLFSYVHSFSDKMQVRFGTEVGILHYSNPLTEYELYPDDKYDRAFSQDIRDKYVIWGGAEFNSNTKISHSVLQCQAF